MVTRLAKSRLDDALADTPVVVVQGPRQCGKSTLVQSLAHGPYVTLDDSLSRSAASLTPASFLTAHGPRLVLDEVQREPGLFREIKKLVDRDRSPGRFLLTGSANILLLPKLSDSLAGRMEVVPLWPLAQAEIEGANVAFADWAFGDAWPQSKPCDNLQELILKGGFPEPFSRSMPTRRRAWFDSYVKALIERDVRDMADIDGLAHLPRLLSALAHRPYEVLNVSALARETGVPHTTLTRYIGLLEGVFLLNAIPAWTATQARVAKTERLAFVDSGVWAHLRGPGPVSVEAIEMFLAMELVKQKGWAETDYEVMHFRSIRQHSVPIVLRRSDGKVVGVTVIYRSEPEPGDFKALEFFAEVVGKEFHRGFVLHSGSRCGPVTEHLGAAPVNGLWAPAL
ncbi:MAG: ATP-binding protein [Armatimonadota bacterium]